MHAYRFTEGINVHFLLTTAGLSRYSIRALMCCMLLMVLSACGGGGSDTAASTSALLGNTPTASVSGSATLTASTTSPTASFPIGKGMIIPAYITLDNVSGWNVLKEGAAKMRTGTNANHKDYWVTVNSATSGSFSTAADWAKAATVWDPIRSNGGRIFGYVHTCEQPTGPIFRPLATVKSEIAAWVAGYPKLDGIWLDEYYPRFEIASVDGATGPSYPNGLANAPTDRSSFVNSANQFNGLQVNPAGGYYDQLVTWIRATYPTLRIIGNAGGAFYSNQLLYSDLPDVLVSFEQNFSVAANAPTNNWSNLTRQIPNSKSGQLALIHGNATSMDSAVDQALAKGYTHVYTTDRVIENNLWGDLPTYLTSLIEYIANRP
jgi:Spherulation-specific family 4